MEISDVDEVENTPLAENSTVAAFAAVDNAASTAQKDILKIFIPIPL